MGRRKIEIEPITNERNRSVTFLKRKNGLFKKAYELGVLCSVDIALIVFEERPGHPVKLHQYCSGNANNVIQRHIRFDGPRELRGPHDFNDKHGDPDEDEDDFMEEDEPEAPPPPPARQSYKSNQASGSSKTLHRTPSTRDVQPATKRPRLDSLPLDSEPSESIPSLANYRYTQPHPISYPSAHHHTHSSSTNLAALYPPPSSHSWSSAVSSALHTTGAGAAYRDFAARDRAAAAAAAAAASYAAGGGNSSAFDFAAPPPNIRAAAAAAYAAGRADAYAAAAAMNQQQQQQSLPPPPPLQTSSASFDDVFDFDWPVHHAQAGPGPSTTPGAHASGVALHAASPNAPPSNAAASSSRALPVKLPPPTSPDMSWLEFLSAPAPPGIAGSVSGSSASSGGGGSANSVWPALRRDDVWPESTRPVGSAGADDDRGRSAESAASGTSFLPSPVESDGEEWDGKR